jgi:phosphoribosylformylglycinamidine (FGAM) synthase-like amidotransferase family enzyme
LRYPVDANPDGSDGEVAGVTTPDGLAFGLMNHPERALDERVRLAFFANGVRAARALV